MNTHPHPKIKTVALFHLPDNDRAILWTNKIKQWLQKNYPRVKITSHKPQAVIVLGGDGTILEAARKYETQKPVIVGLNLGHVGFLASVREQKNFLKGLRILFSGKHKITERMMLSASVVRNGKMVFKTNSLNDVVIQSILGILEMEVGIERQPIQYIRGTGVLVATATGSTAYNLSAHGPIVMPDIKCFIVTELMDHNIPTPSIVIKRDREIYIKVLNFRKRGILSVTKTGKPVDVILASDSGKVFPLEEADIIYIRRSPRLIRFAEFEKNYFFKSLQEKFAFK
jgi:NAD+ kinase